MFPTDRLQPCAAARIPHASAPLFSHHLNLQVAVESTGDESGDAAQVEKQLLSLLKSKAKLKASQQPVPFLLLVALACQL